MSRDVGRDDDDDYDAGDAGDVRILSCEEWLSKY